MHVGPVHQRPRCGRSIQSLGPTVKTDATFSATREVRTFADLHHAALVMLKKTQEEPRGSAFTTMAALLFTAFTLEAYLNHLGHLRIAFWPEIDSIRVMDKLGCLCKDLSIQPDFSRRPFQTLSQLFRFRNSLAHGRTEVLKAEKQINAEDDPWTHLPKTDWEEFCTLPNALRAREDIGAVIALLHKAAGMGDRPFMHGSATSSVTANPRPEP
jgi:hypothetical protein